MKTAGIIILILVTSSLGFNEAWKLKKRVTLLVEIKKYICFFQTELRYNLHPPGVILEKYAAFSRHPIFEDFRNRMKGGELLFRNAWETTISEEGKSYALTPEDRKLLIEFGEGLGISDLTGQLAHCGMYESYITELCADAEEANRRKSNLYRILGITAGVAVSILLI